MNGDPGKSLGSISSSNAKALRGKFSGLSGKARYWAHISSGMEL